MPTQTPAPPRKPFQITLQVINGNIVPAPGDYETQMQKDVDTAFFVLDSSVPLLTKLEIIFTPLDAKDSKGNIVRDVPFEKAKITNPTPANQFCVKTSCKSMMAPHAFTADGRELHCKWDERGNVTGQNVCTGGGASPVHC
jgi:hypothetical protein